ncbi:hypothetical protein QZH41_018112 [Actinostola sp. cb2023]|nr:hypothetical protein QZH41_018112 [Actinostola sp. cb2023]
MTLHEAAIPASELHVMRNAFSLFDGNGDGRIDLKEFEVVIRAVGFNPTDEQIQTTFKQFDSNNDGEIDFEEFVVMSRNFAGCSRQKLEDNLRQAFRVFDRNGDGYISADELRYALTNVGEKLTPSEAEEFISMLDRDGDGKLVYEEFVVIAKKSLSECLKAIRDKDTLVY